MTLQDRTIHSLRGSEEDDAPLRGAYKKMLEAAKGVKPLQHSPLPMEPRPDTPLETPGIDRRSWIPEPEDIRGSAKTAVELVAEARTERDHDWEELLKSRAKRRSIGDALSALTQLASVRRGGPAAPITGEGYQQARAASDAAKLQEDEKQMQWDMLELQQKLEDWRMKQHADIRTQDWERRREATIEDQEAAEQRRIEQEKRAFKDWEKKRDRLTEDELSRVEREAKALGVPRHVLERQLHEQRMELKSFEHEYNMELQRAREEGRRYDAHPPVTIYQEDDGKFYSFNELGATVAFNELVRDPEVLDFIEDVWDQITRSSPMQLSPEERYHIVSRFAHKLPVETRAALRKTYGDEKEEQDQDPLGLYR